MGKGEIVSDHGRINHHIAERVYDSLSEKASALERFNAVATAGLVLSTGVAKYSDALTALSGSSAKVAAALLFGSVAYKAMTVDSDDRRFLDRTPLEQSEAYKTLKNSVRAIGASIAANTVATAAAISAVMPHIG